MSDIIGWQSTLEEILCDFGFQNKVFSIPYHMAEKSCSDISLHNSYVNMFASSILSCKENEKDAMSIFNNSHIIDKPISINKTLNLLNNLYKLYIREYDKMIKSRTWQGQLENLFDVFVHQNTLEYAADYMVDFSCEDKMIHDSYMNLLQMAISSCREHKGDAMNAINNGTGYMPQSIEETLDLTTELYNLYLREYESRISTDSIS